MRRFERIGPAGGLACALAVFLACGGGLDEEPLPPGVAEIPVTTKSRAALQKFRKAQEYLDVGRSKEANPIFENATGKDPTFSWAYLNAALTAASVREFNDYLKLAQTYLEGKSEGERLLVEIAQTYVDNDVPGRVELSRALVKTYPRSRRAWLARAEVQSVLQEHAEARESLDKALELDPGFVATQVAIGRSYLYNQPRDLARAEQAMQACLAIDPEEGKFHENLADVYRAMNRLEEARELYTVAVEKDPGLSDASLKRGHTLSFLGRLEEARADYDAAIDGAQGQTRLGYRRYRAYAHLHAGDPQAAIDDLTALLAEVEEIGLPRDQVAGAKQPILDDLAAIQLHHGRLDEAEATLAELAAVGRTIAEQAKSPAVEQRQDAAVRLWEGRLAARRGDVELARSKAEDYRRLLTDDAEPSRDESYEGLLGLIELLQERPEAAIEHLEKSDLGDVYFQYLLARAHEDAGDPEEARRLFGEVATWNFNSVGFALVRAEAMEKSS